MSKLPQLTVKEMLKLPPADCIKYVREGEERGAASIPDEAIATIIRRYREGASQRKISVELGVSTSTVFLWLERCEQHNIVHIRRLKEVKVGRLEEEAAQTEVRILKKKEALLDADAKLSNDIREKIEIVLKELTPEKAKTTKWKDLVDSLAKLVEKDRLLSNKSTSNSQSVVQYITQLNTMPLADRQKMAQARLAGGAKRALPAPKADTEEDEDGEKSEDEEWLR